MTALFTAKATAKGGRSGHVASDDGILDYDLVMPNEKRKERQEQILNSCLPQGMQHASAAHWNSSPKSRALILNLR